MMQFALLIGWLLATTNVACNNTVTETPPVPSVLLDPAKELHGASEQSEEELAEQSQVGPAPPPAAPKPTQAPTYNDPIHTSQYPWELASTIRSVRSTRRTLLARLFQGYQPTSNKQAPAELNQQTNQVSAGGVAIPMPEGETDSKQWSVDILDCTRPSSVVTIAKSRVCDQSYTSPLSEDTKHFVILQQEVRETREAIRCSLTVTSISVICGMFSHESLVQSPTLNEPRALPNDCDSIIKSGRIVLEGQRVVQTPIGSRTDYRFVSTGSQTITANDIRCQGSVTTLQNGDTLDGVVTLNTATVRLMKTSILFAEDGKIIDLENNEELPGTCRLGTSCTARNYVEYVIAPADGCNMRKIRKAKMQTGRGQFGKGEKNFVVSTEHQILLTMEEEHSIPSACGFSSVITTDQRHIFLKPITPENINAVNRLKETNDVDVDLELRTTNSFASWWTGEQLKRALKHTASRLCSIGTSTSNHDEDEYIVSPFSPSSIIKPRGQLLLQLKCLAAVAVATEGTRVTNKPDLCSANYFPVTYGGSTQLMHAASGVIVGSSNQLDLRSCDRIYSPLIVSRGGTVLVSDETGTHEVQVHLHSESEFFHIDQSTTIHGGMSLLYSDREIDKLGRAVSHGFSKTALLSSITDFYCKEDEETCGSPGVGGSPFNPVHLMPAHPLSTLGLGFLSDWWHIISGVGNITSIAIVFYLLCRLVACILIVIKYIALDKMRAMDATRLVLWPQTMFKESYELNKQKKETLRQMRMNQIIKDDEVEDLIDEKMERMARQTTREPSVAHSQITAELH